jgi:hypothetical protein
MRRRAGLDPGREPETALLGRTYNRILAPAERGIGREIRPLTASLKEQAAQIHKVSDRLN